MLQYHAIGLTVVGGGEQIQAETFVPFVWHEGSIQFMISLDTG